MCQKGEHTTVMTTAIKLKGWKVLVVHDVGTLSFTYLFCKKSIVM